MDSSVSLEDRIWFLRVCRHIPFSLYLFYRRLGEPQGRSGRAENLVPTGIRSRTVQPVVSHYTDWATGPIQWSIKHIVQYICWLYVVNTQVPCLCIVIVAIPALPYFSTLSHKGQDFVKKVIEHEIVFRFSLQLLSEMFPSLRRIQWRTVRSAHMSLFTHMRSTVIRVRF